MKTNAILTVIESILKQRADVKETEVQRSKNASYLCISLETSDQRVHGLIFHPLSVDGQSYLRVCHMNAAVIPPVINEEKFCAALNKDILIGRFVVNERARGLLSFLVHHMTLSDRVEPLVLERLIALVIRASGSATEIVLGLVHHAQEQSICDGAGQFINPVLN